VSKNSSSPRKIQATLESFSYKGTYRSPSSKGVCSHEKKINAQAKTVLKLHKLWLP
jgi:hypothetical protein